MTSALAPSLLRAAPGLRRPRPGCRAFRVLGAVLVYLAASQGPVVAELVHQGDHLLRAPTRTLTAAEWTAGPTAPHSHGPAAAAPADHSHGVLLDGILAAAEQAGDSTEIAVTPVVPLHLPGAPPVQSMGVLRGVAQPRAPAPPPVPASLRTPPTPPPRG
jgi:hypothetical protein